MQNLTIDNLAAKIAKLSALVKLDNSGGGGARAITLEATRPQLRKAGLWHPEFELVARGEKRCAHFLVQEDDEWTWSVSITKHPKFFRLGLWREQTLLRAAFAGSQDPAARRALELSTQRARVNGALEGAMRARVPDPDESRAPDLDNDLRAVAQLICGQGPAAVRAFRTMLGDRASVPE